MFEHTEKKYTIITGLWKVYAILLEYCCKLDYKMIITTLNIEKKAELDELEANYNNQIGYFEENQRILEKTLNDTKEQVRNLQRKLDFEIQKKEELEDELMQKGSGHEEEVSTRIQFESKVNQMYAKQRDMETKALIMEDTIEDLKKNVEAKSVLLLKEKKNYENIFNAKERIEAEYRRADELNKLLTISNTSLENRLNEAYVKVEDLTNQTSKLMAQYSEAQNALTRKKIEVEDKNFELDLKESTITKLSSIIEDLKLEKNVYVKRVVELENLFSEECDKNQHYKQEYTRIKESDNFYAVECMKNKDKADSLEVQCEDLKEEKNKFKIQLESLIQSCEEFKVQLKKSQERIEEMNKGRRMVEEQNEFLNSRLSERVHELKDARSMNLELKDDVEKLKTKENSLESEVTTLTIKLRSLEKQYDANKDTMQGKINSLSDILSTEKQIRENWIFKFEEEQKSHSTSSKLLVMTQDQQNELQMKFNSNLLLLDEKTQKIKMQMTRISEQLEEILELKAFQEELQRKNKTLQMLYEDSEKERLEMIQRHLKDIEVLNGLHEEAKENLLLGIEEIRVRAWVNLEKFMKKTEDFNELEGKYYSLVDLQKETADKLSEVTWMWNRQSMCSEDLSIRLCGTLNDLFDLTEKHEDLSERFETVTSKYLFFISLIPEHLKDIENPFGVLTGQIEVLEEELRKIEYFKSNMVDFEVQFDAVAISLDENTQTDIGFSFFEKNRKMSGAGTPHSGSQRVYSAKSKEGPSTIHEYQGKSRDRSFPQKLDSGLREETPINMASVYNQ